MVKGFALNDDRFINGNRFDTRYFDELMAIDFTKEDLTNASIPNAYNYQTTLLYVKR